MADLREHFDNPEEAFRAMFGGLQRHLHTSMVSRVTETSKDGHAVQVQPVVQQQLQDPTLTKTTYQDFPLIPDAVVHFPGGAGATLTHGLAVGDETVVSFSGRALDFWRQQGGTAQPASDRMHSLSDAVASGSVRSDPRKLMQVASDAMHLRDDAKHAVHEVKPGVGVQSFHADPSTAPASASFDPLTMASKFLSHAVAAAKGIVGSAVDGATSHTHGVAHGIGAWMSAANSLHSVLCHPSQGASLNAQNLLHNVTAGPLGAIMSAFGGKHTVSALASGLSLQSAAGISLSCPAGGLSLPSGGVSAGSLASGAASTNVDTLSGDLSGTLPAPQVVGLHVDFSQYPAATSDAAAAAAGVQIGSLYRNTAALAGVSLLAVRMS